MKIFDNIKEKFINVPKIPKKTQVIIIVIFVVLATAVSLGIIYREDIIAVLKNQELSDSIKFKREYTEVEDNNIFYYASYNEIIEVLTKKTGIVFFGFPSCPWCQAYAPILDEVAKEQDSPKIYYYNIKEMRKNNTQEYKALVEIIKANLLKDEDGLTRIYVPDVYFVKDGKILGHNNDTSTKHGADTKSYYTEEVRASLKITLKTLTEKVYPTNCDDEKGC